ncbi:hypothetical protein J6590_008786 [Homalodisca vitripennis]|nr:hypothetical protein J6590_008786 [Homalodisca vitripennis]
MGLVSADYTWPNALQTIRLTFFSSRAIRDIQSKLMYRQQRPSEPYADYLTDIVSIFQILGPEISDAEIFYTIFTGLYPHTRAAFAGLQVPTTVQQLKNMVSMIESLTVNSVQAPLGYGKSESRETAIDSNQNVTYDNTNLHYAGQIFRNSRDENRTFYRSSGRTFHRGTAKRAPYSTFYPNHAFGVPVLIGFNFIQASEMRINAAQRQVSFTFDTSLVIAENQEDDKGEEDSLGPIFGERLDSSQVQAFKNILQCFPETVTKQLGKKNAEVIIALKKELTPTRIW